VIDFSERWVGTGSAIQWKELEGTIERDENDGEGRDDWEGRSSEWERWWGKRSSESERSVVRLGFAWDIDCLRV
jgi:hypothetical protein